MSSDPGPAAGPSGPPWSIDALADLQAGVYPDDVSARLRAQIAGDAEAMAMLAALDSTVDALSLLPTPRMPERYALRLDAAITSESSARATRWAPGGAVAGTRQMAPSVFGPPGSRPPADQNHPERQAPSPSQQLTSAPPAGSSPFGTVPPGSVPAQFNPQDQYDPQHRFNQQQPFDQHSPFRPQDRSAGPGVAPWQGSAGPGVAPDAPVRPGTPSAVRSDAYAGANPDPAAGNVVSLDAARAKRRRWIGGVGIAAAVVLAATITLTSLHHSPADQSATGGPPAATASPTAGNPGASNALELTPGRFQQAFQQINGAHSGPLTDPLTSAACFGANDIVGSDVLGVTQVTYGGREASAIAVRISATQARVVVVGLSCGVNGAKAALESETVTR